MTGSKHVHYYVLLAAFFLKILFLLFFIHHFQLWGSHTLAVNLVNSGDYFINMDGVKNHSYQFPVYPFIVSSLYYLFGIHPVLACLYNVFLNFCAGIVFVLLMEETLSYFSIKVLSERKIYSILLISLSVYVLHPAINFYTLYNVHPFMQNMFFLLTTSWLSFRYARILTCKNSLLLGLFLGLSIMDRGTALMAILPFIIIVFRQKGSLVMVQHTCIILSLAFTVCLPWLVHNYLRDHFIGLESSAGKDMVKGILEDSEGSNYLKDGNYYYKAFAKAEIDSIGKMPAGLQDKYYLDKVYEKWRARPGFALKMYFIKLKNFWWFRTRAGNELNRDIQKLVPVYKIIYLIFLILASSSCLFIGRKTLTLLSVPIAISIIQSAFYVETRHRILVEPILIYIAIITITFILSQNRPPGTCAL